MHASVHPVDGVPGPHDNSWADPVLTALGARAVPAGALVARPMGLGSGLVVALWADAADAAAATPGLGSAGPVTVGPGPAYRIAAHRAGRSTGPARFLQVVTFRGRSERWGQAFDRADEERIWPAVRDLPGLVASLTGAGPDGARVVVTATDSIEQLHAGAAAILSTTLLPWEDPADLTGPDDVAVLWLVHAHLPTAAAAR